MTATVGKKVGAGTGPGFLQRLSLQLHGTSPVHRPTARLWMLAPTVGLLLFVTVFPFFYALYVSFHQWKTTLPIRSFIGVEHYAALVTSDTRFLNAVTNTALFTGAGLTMQFVLGFALAVFFWKNFVRHQWLITLVLVPMIISPVVVGFTARTAFTNDFGFINPLLSVILRSDVSLNWLSEPGLAPWVIIFADVWQWTPFVFLVLLAGLLAVPHDILEAAQVDGAHTGQILWHVVVPLMRPIIIIVLILRGLEIIKIFDVIMLATRAGPGIATETISVYVYNIAFRFFDLGYASAAAILLLIAVSAIVFAAVRMIGRRA